MKKTIYFFAILTTLVLAACGSDDEPTVPVSVADQNMALLVVNESASTVNYVGGAVYSFDVDAEANTLQVNVQGAKFDSRMPHDVSFLISDVTIAGLTRNGANCSFRFSASTAAMLNPATSEPYSGYEITDVKGFVDTAKGIFTVNYKVVTRGATYTVYSTRNAITTAIADATYDGTSSLYYEYDLDTEAMTADVYIYNVQFSVDGASSPLLPKILIPGVKMIATATGYTLNGDGIIPSNITAGGPVPMGERFVVTNLSATLNLATGAHSIYFNCMGGEHAGNAKLAL